MMLLRTSEGVFQDLVFKKHLFFLTSFQLSNSFSKKKQIFRVFQNYKNKVYTLTFILQYYYQSIFDDKNNFLVM